MIQDHSHHRASKKRWIHVQSGFVGSSDAPWSEWSWIINTDTDPPKGMHAWWGIFLRFHQFLRLKNLRTTILFCSVKLSTSALAVRNSTAPKDDDDQTKDSWSVWPSVHRITMKTQPNQTSMSSQLSNAINSMRMLCHSKSRRIFCPVYDVTSQRWITGPEKSQIPPEALFSSTSKKGKERERLASKLKKRVLSYFSSEEKLKTEERTNRPVFVLRSTCGL